MNDGGRILGGKAIKSCAIFVTVSMLMLTIFTASRPI